MFDGFGYSRSGRGDSHSQSRSALLAESRRQREERAAHKLRQSSAVRLQSLIRGRQTRNKLKEKWRSEFDDLIRSDTQCLRAVHVVRLWTAFMKCDSLTSNSADRRRMSDAVKYLTTAMRSPSTSIFAHDNTSAPTVRLQLTRIIALLVRALTAPTLSADVSAIAFLLFQSINGDTHALRTVQFAALNAVGAHYYSDIRTAIVTLTPQTTANTQRNTKDTNTIGLLLLCAVQPFTLRRYMESRVDFPLSSLFVRHILTIPLLEARIRCAGGAACISVLQDRVMALSVLDIALAPLLQSSGPLEDFGNSSTQTDWEKARPTESTLSSAVAMNISNDDDESGNDSSTHITQSPPTSFSNSLWILSNLLSYGKSRAFSSERNIIPLTQFIHIIQRAIVSVPPNEWPDSRSAPATHHPLLINALSILWDRTLLQKLLLDPALDVGTVQTVCVVFDQLISSYPDSQHHILAIIAFGSPMIARMWKIINTKTSSNEAAMKIGDGTLMSAAATQDILHSVVPLFCAAFAYLLLMLSDVEMYEKDTPIPISDMPSLVDSFMTLAYRLYWSEWSSASSAGAVRLRHRLSKLLTLLRDRHARRSLCDHALWTMKGLNVQQWEAEWNDEHRTNTRVDEPPTGRASELYISLPFAIPFEDRLRVFYQQIQRDRDSAQNLDIHGHLGGLRCRIRRERLFEDAYDALNDADSQKLKHRVQVEFVGEAGIDGGGLMKEMLTALAKTAFDPVNGLFLTTQQQTVYPNPDSLLIAQQTGQMLQQVDLDGEDQQYSDPQAEVQRQLSYYLFLGKIIGKCIYDRIQIECEFTLSFVKHLLGQTTNVDDLYTLDAQLYNSLIKLTTLTPEQLAALQLTFTVDRNILNQIHTDELIPNGANIYVDESNVRQFMYRMAFYKLIGSNKQQMSAFASGLYSIVKREWLTAFTADELSRIISGDDHIQISDLKANTLYSGGYSAQHQLIQWFWAEVDTFTPAEQAALIKFVTACPRAPLQGFASLNPKLCIQRVNADENEQTLPTAATCMNLLRMPRYTSTARLRERILYAIQHGTGFQLT